MKGNSLSICLLLFVLALFPNPEANAQHFGRNKPSYEKFDFKVRHNPNFKLYHYLKNDSLLEAFSAAAEEWYHAHQQVFLDTFALPSPFILYANHADFWQTSALLGTVSIGTGGVTEGLRNRVIMPMMELNSQTHHVLGHELVHVFQYRMMKNPEDSLTLNNIQNLPLWMVEGLAEYLSTGPVDPHTAMWMRDALRANDFPTLKEMTRSYKYFPYRYGQAFWSYIVGTYGDSVISPLFRKTAWYGYEKAIEELTGLDEKAFSEAWKEDLTNYYRQYNGLRSDSLRGRLLAEKKKSGNINIAPVISPNGQYVAFLSEKNFFGIDLFLADAKTGEILKTMATTVRENHIDEFSYIESSGTWSPLSDRFAFVGFSEGSSVLTIVDMNAKGKTTAHKIPGVPYFSNPAWSPDGEDIVVSGMVEGQSDLFLFNLKTGKVTRLTNDWYSDVQPQWSPDGRFILFASDRPAPGRQYHSKSLQISLYDREEKDVTVIDMFNGAENLNPVFAPDGKSIYFLSNRDGFRNLYSYEFASGRIKQLTDYVTGITGITTYAPALSVSSETGELAYSYFDKASYSIYVARPDEFTARDVTHEGVDFSAGTLPPKSESTVVARLQQLDFLPFKPTEGKTEAYKPKLGLEYIGNQAGIGIATSSFGTRTGMAGGIDMIFGDMLGYHRLFGTLSLNGEIYDFGGQAAYLNEKSRVNWGFAVSHIPYRSSYLGFKPDTLIAGPDTLVTTNMFLDVLRAFDKSIEGFVSFPFSTTRRVEFGTGYSFYSFRVDRYNNYYYDGYLIHETREKLPSPEGYNLGSTYAAYVLDNSYFGIASPMRGRRFRIELEKTYDALDYHTLFIDYRHYAFLNPTSLAFRILHLGRFGADAEDNRLYPLSFAYPTLTRGNEPDNIEGYDTDEGGSHSIDQIFGSRMIVANAEWRIPFTGPERLTPIKSKVLFTELALFADAGIAWTSSTHPTFKWDPESPGDRVPFLSTGLALRLNLFGLMVIEPYYALPWRRDHFARGVFGVNFSPGW
ncbi:MAG TPA: tolB protein precursor [Cyclobacteriaceae bacterium]|jgi:Tol biopolymer transport system component